MVNRLDNCRNSSKRLNKTGEVSALAYAPQGSHVKRIGRLVLKPL